MAFGFLNSIIPNADQNVTLYTSPANTLTQGKVSISSKVTNPVRIRLSIREAGGQVTDLKYLEYNKYINYAEVFETGEINIGPEQELVVRCDHPDVSFLLTGETFDESNADLGTHGSPAVNTHSGLLGCLISTNSDKKELYKVPFSGDRPDLRTDATVVICNVGPTVARARIGLIQTGDILSSFSVEDYIEYEVAILPGQTYTRPGVKLIAGESIVVSSSDRSNLQFLLHGRLKRETGDISTKDLTASGDITGNTLSVYNASVSGILTAPSIDGEMPYGTLVGGGVTINGSGINAGTGVVTATKYYGNGTELSGIVTSLSAGANIDLSATTGGVVITSIPSSLNVIGVSTLGVTTFTGTISIGSSVLIGDDKKIIVGNDSDLSVFYDSSNNVAAFESDSLIFRTKSTPNENYITGLANGPVEFYYDGSKKFGTADSGVSVLGDLEVSGIVTATSYNSALEMDLVTQGQTRVAITSTGTSIFKSGLAQKYNIVATNAGTSPSQSINSGNIIKFTGNETGNNINLNISDVNGDLVAGESISITAIITPNGVGDFGSVTIDGQPPSGGLKWTSGNAPSGSASGDDVYTFTILKTGSSATDYVVYGAKTNYA